MKQKYRKLLNERIAQKIRSLSSPRGPFFSELRGVKSLFLEAKRSSHFKKSGALYECALIEKNAGPGLEDGESEESSRDEADGGDERGGSGGRGGGLSRGLGGHNGGASVLAGLEEVGRRRGTIGGVVADGRGGDGHVLAFGAGRVGAAGLSLERVVDEAVYAEVESTVGGVGDGLAETEVSEERVGGDGGAGAVLREPGLDGDVALTHERHGRGRCDWSNGSDGRRRLGGHGGGLGGRRSGRLDDERAGDGERVATGGHAHHIAPGGRHGRIQGRARVAAVITANVSLRDSRIRAVDVAGNLGQGVDRVALAVLRAGEDIRSRSRLYARRRRSKELERHLCLASRCYDHEGGYNRQKCDFCYLDHFFSSRFTTFTHHATNANTVSTVV